MYEGLRVAARVLEGTQRGVEVDVAVARELFGVETPTHFALAAGVGGVVDHGAVAQLFGRVGARETLFAFVVEAADDAPLTKEAELVETCRSFVGATGADACVRVERGGVGAHRGREASLVRQTRELALHGAGRRVGRLAIDLEDRQHRARRACFAPGGGRMARDLGVVRVACGSLRERGGGERDGEGREGGAEDRRSHSAKGRRGGRDDRTRLRRLARRVDECLR